MAEFFSLKTQNLKKKKKEEEEVYVVEDSKGKKVNQNKSKEHVETRLSQATKYKNDTDFFTPTTTKTNQNKEIAPIKKTTSSNNKRTWFDSGAFDDGYQFGDVTKSILGTVGNIGDSLATGVARIGEGVIDSALYLAGGIADKTGNKTASTIAKAIISADTVDIAKSINNSYRSNVLYDGKLDEQKYIKDNSLLGEKSSSLIESGGQLAGTVALQAAGVPWWVTTGVTSFGSGTQEAFNNGATYGQAGAYGAISAGAEILTEKLSGGISFGGKTLDDALIKPLTEKISSKTLKVLANFGIDALGEGTEEIVSSVMQNVGKKLTYENEKTWKELLTSEEAMDEYLEGFIGGAVLGGGSSVINSVRSNNEIAPINPTAQAEGLQQEIANKQEELSKSQDAREQQIIQEEIEQLNTELNELTNAQQITDEKELRKQKFTYQAQETDSDIKKAVYESASQLMNNTQNSHKFVDVVAKIAEEKGTTYKFTNNEQLKQLGYAKDNVTVNGLVNENGEVLINIDSAKALNRVVGHETTHLLEGTKEYEALKQVAIEYAKSKGDYDTRIESLTKLYEGTNADIEAELTSDIVGDYLFTDENFIKELSVKQPTVFEKIKNFISDLVVKFKGTDQEKQLRQLQRSFEKAYKAQTTQTNTKVKYSLSEDGKMVDTSTNEEVKLEAAETGTHGTLMAMHNLSDFKLKGILELGGFPVPSIAITKPSVNFTDYGEISVIFDKETINPTNKQNEVYGSDVYSPRFPQTVNELNDAGVKQVAKILGMSDYEFEANYENMTIDDVVNRLTREEHIIDKYLESKNITVDPIYKTYSAERSGVSKKFVENFLNAHEELKNNDINLRELDYEKYSNEVKQIYIDSLVQQGVPIEEAQDLYSNFEKADITKFLIDVRNFKKAISQGQQIDNYATKRAKEQHIDFYSDEYRSFVENLIAPAFGDKYIRNGKDLFTPSGNRRSFKQLHDAYNLENVVKNMKGKVRGEEGFFYGAGNIRSQVTPQFKSIAEIKASEGKLVTAEQMEEVKRDINSDLNNLSVTARNFGGHTYDSYEYALNEIAELKKITPDATRDILNENGFKNVPDILVQKSIEFLEKLKNAPTEYFEAKPQRAVGFDEVEAIVVPNNMSADLKQQLYDKGFNVIEYDPNIEGDRQAKINKLDDLKFSLSAQNEEIAPTGNYNVYGKDVKLQVEEAIAPLQEKIESLTEQLDTVVNSIEQKQEVPEAAPVQEAQPTRPTLEEVQNLMNIKENQSGSDYARAFFALRDKYGQPNLYKSLNEYYKTGTIVEESNAQNIDIAPTSQDIVEKQGQEAFNNITDNEAPIDVSNMSFEDAVDAIMESGEYETTSTEHIPSPLDSRDIDEVGNRKVKAYQYENPEVKPYFQQEAQAMLGDLDSTIKGARTPVLDQDGYITGWYGIERQTTEAISYLKDKYGYSYEQIRQGLNKIIEDDGLENNAVSKRIEFMLDERLREGYTTSDGFPIPPNEEYINFLNEKQITEYNKEAFNALTDLDVPLDIAPEAPEFDLSQNLKASEQLIPMTEKVAQNQNMSEEYLAIAPEKSSEPKMLRVKEPQKLGKVEGRVTEPTIPEPVNNAKQLTLDGKEEDLVAKTKKQLRRELIEPNKEFFANALDNAKNRSMAFMNNTDTIRNTELVFGREAGKVINDAIFQKEIDNEADSIAWQNKERQEIKDLGIKARSKESAAVQKYGEKQYVNEEGKLVPYGDKELAREFPDIDTQNNIKQAAQVIRNKYDNYIDEANEVLTGLGFDPIKKRTDYMRHFQELTDVFSRYGIPFNAKNMQEHVLPTDINGLTEFWSPQKNYFANMQPRKGIKTTYDAITGIDGYISGISNLIFHTEDIQRGRAFEELIRETYGEAKGWENLEKLPDELKQARADKIQENHLSNYAAWVHEWTNNVAGKKNKLDRSVEATFGRKAFSVLDEARKQVGTNMIGFNVSSSLTNLVAPMQAMSKTNKLAMAKGTADTIKNIFVKDNFVEKNKFLTSRFGTDMLSKNAWQKIQDAGFVFMKGTDWFTANQIVRSKYYELRAKGLSDADAHTQAGQFAARIMGDRTKGAAPQLYNSKLVGLVTQFQLEVNNQLYSQFYDTYQESKENAKGNALKTAAGMTFTLGQLFAYTHLFGQTFESIAGYNPTFDVIEMIKTAFGWGEDEDEEKTTSERLKAAADQLVDALPYVNILTGGGRIPIASGIPNLVGVATGATDDYGNEITLEDELKKLLYLLPPTGGNQFKKTTQGLSMFDDDFPIAGSYTDSGNLRYTVEDNAANRLQAGLFGKWANKNAQAYIDSDFKTIDKDNIEELVELGFDSNEYRDYKKGLNEIKRMELEDGKSRMPELFDYIDSQDVTEEQKSIMIKHLLSDEEAEDLSGLNMSTEQTVDYYKAKASISQQIAEYANDKSLLTGDTESEEYKEAVNGLSDDKKVSIIDTIKNTNLTDEQKSYLYGKYYSSDKTLDKIKESGIDFDDFLTYSKDSLSLETTEDKAKYLYEADLTDEAKTVIYETSVLTGFDDEKKYKDYKVAKAVGVDINSWLSYKKQEFVADKDSDGDSIRGSRKDKIISYINSLELNIPQKAAMIRTEYSTFDDYNNDIVNYVNELDLEYEEKIKILENLDFTIGKDGSVYWD